MGEKDFLISAFSFSTTKISFGENVQFYFWRNFQKGAIFKKNGGSPLSNISIDNIWIRVFASVYQGRRSIFDFQLDEWSFKENVGCIWINVLHSFFVFI